MASAECLEGASVGSVDYDGHNRLDFDDPGLPSRQEDDEPASTLTVVQAGPFHLEDLERLVQQFETPGHPLNALVPPGVILEVGMGEGRVGSIILMSFIDEETLPLAVALRLSVHLDTAFNYPADTRYDTDRLVFVQEKPVREHYVRSGRTVLVIRNGVITLNETGLAEDELLN
jgi:hypothetical protein